MVPPKQRTAVLCWIILHFTYLEHHSMLFPVVTYAPPLQHTSTTFSYKGLILNTILEKVQVGGAPTTAVKQYFIQNYMQCVVKFSPFPLKDKTVCIFM